MDKDKIERLVEIHKYKPVEELKSIVSQYNREGLYNMKHLCPEDIVAICQILEPKGIDTDDHFREPNESRSYEHNLSSFSALDAGILMPIAVIGLCVWMFKGCAENGLVLGLPIAVGLMMLKWMWEDWLSKL